MKFLYVSDSKKRRIHWTSYRWSCYVLSIVWYILQKYNKCKWVFVSAERYVLVDGKVQPLSGSYLETVHSLRSYCGTKGQSCRASFVDVLRCTSAWDRRMDSKDQGSASRIVLCSTWAWERWWSSRRESKRGQPSHFFAAFAGPGLCQTHPSPLPWNLQYFNRCRLD